MALTRARTIAAAVVSGLLLIGGAAAIERSDDEGRTLSTVDRSSPTSRTATGVVEGRTWANDSQRRSTVALMRDDRVVAKATADAHGHYVLTDVPPGRYELWAEAAGRPEAVSCSTPSTSGSSRGCLIPPANGERREVEVRAGDRHRVDFV